MTPSKRRKLGYDAFDPSVDPDDVCPYHPPQWGWETYKQDWMDGFNQAKQDHEKEQEEKVVENNNILALLKHGEKIRAVNEVKHTFGVGTDAAKSFVEAIDEEWVNKRNIEDEKVMAHWNLILDAVHQLPIYAEQCEYCQNHMANGCKTCPIRKKTGDSSCHGTPYYEVRNAHNALLKAIKKEQEFLKEVIYGRR